ncbi:MAG: Hsp20/alpha crystallin family protein [Phycisphaerae bacterium]|jgi:HSP20 family protein
MISTFRATGEEGHSSMARQMSRWVNHVLGGSSYHKYCPGETWAPTANVYEDERSYCVVFDLAGVQASTVDLRVEEGVLVLTGQRNTPEMPDSRGETKVHVMEIDHGRYCRRLDLPEDVDIEASSSLSANYRNGYLWISLPKRSAK